jgi:GT2 family glycosyltransferase/ubiquinone/menaquinone biosynthesis C-methylase UbiE
MPQKVTTSDLRSHSEKKHKQKVWGSDIHSVPEYLKYFINFFSFKHAGIDRLAKACKTDARILDYGAGNGNFGAYLSTSCESAIFAVDWSIEALRQARKKFSRRRIFSVCADLHSLPFKEASFTAFFTIDVFGHLHDPPKAIGALYNVLKPGAKGFFHSECSDYRKRWPDSWLITKNGRDIPAEADDHISLSTVKELHSLITPKFSVLSSFSPAGYTGWLTGYPEKYTDAFYRAGNKFLFFIVSFFSKIKANHAGKVLLRIFNYLTNRIELLLNLQGGGSFFADVIKPVSEKKTSESSIDIIIPTVNRSAQVQNLVNHLLPQCRNDDSIIIVSQDESLKLHSIDSKVHVLYTTPANLPKARNLGMQSGTNNIILFLDDDTIISAELLDQHRVAYSNSTINCIAGSVDDPRFTRSTASPSEFDPKTSELIQNFLYPKATQSISFMGAHFSFRRSILDKVGFFDTSFIGNAYWEDIDFSFRLQKKGYSIHYNPDIRVIHSVYQTGGCRSKTKGSYCYNYFTNSTYFSLKYIPLKYARSWFSYWKYRLEFETRSSEQTSRFKHNPILLTASLWGIITGIFRFLLKCKRIGLPTAVLHNQKSESI